MVFRDDDQYVNWPPPPGQPRRFSMRHAWREQDEQRLSLRDTLRELMVTILGFVGAIALITAAVRFFHG